MASNKLNAKAKGRDDRGKGNNKSIIPSNEENDDIDFSLLRKPVQTSITGFAQARKIFDTATEELKGLLSEECDLLYECKVCRNLFRSLANFISHKRVYCQNKFNATVHGHFIKPISMLHELSQIQRIEEGFQESLKQQKHTEHVDEVDERIPLTKDLTAIVEKVAKSRGNPEYLDNEPQLSFQKIPSSSMAVFQNIKMEKMDAVDMRTEVTELNDILSHDMAILQQDEKFKIASSLIEENPESHTEGVIQISDDEDNVHSNSLKCQKCELQFSTQKTLKFHMKYKHVDTRLVFPCPDCCDIFSTSWSVYRHLFKVHRKTPAQIRKLRESIQANAFKMNNPPAFYEKRKNNMKPAPVQKISEEERLDQENQAWLDNMECDGGAPRCGGCGRTFERRAALAAHTHTCAPRLRALRRPDAKRIEIQIRKDYNKGPPSLVLPKTEVNENKMKEVKDKNATDTFIKVENEVVPEQIAVDEGSRDSGMQLGEDETASKSPSESPEKREETSAKPETETTVNPPRLPFAQHAEKNNLMAFRQRIIPDIELDTLKCKKCDTKYENIQHLYDHVAKHYNWMRYACKLCNFKHYDFEKLPEHVKVVHKLKGDKDFYFSTVKALDGTEASELATPVGEPPEMDEASPDSRRPSRCSSDSSRVSDDSSSSNTRIEGARKRKMIHKATKPLVKLRKSLKGTKDVDEEWTDKDDSVSNSKTFEENSSDIDDTYERVVKNRVEEFATVTTRRPVRRKTKPKNEDFEYDLSNLLKMEAQGYRESQTVSTNPKSSQTKKKIQTEPLNTNNYQILNKESCGALVLLSRKAVEHAKAHMKTAATLYIQKEKPSSIFVRPMLPKGIIRIDKSSPKKDVDDKKQTTVQVSKEIFTESAPDLLNKETNNVKNIEKDCTADHEISASVESQTEPAETSTEIHNDVGTNEISNSNEQHDIQNNANISNDKVPKKHKSITIPFKFRRNSIEVIKNNPIINKNISEFTKAGMKTKILVIKPINRKKDGLPAVNTSLKFQTIKLKDANKCSSGEDKSEQVVVVKVPKVDHITRPHEEMSIVPHTLEPVVKKTERIPSAPDDILAPIQNNQTVLEAPKSIEICSMMDNTEINSSQPGTEEMIDDEIMNSKAAASLNSDNLAIVDSNNDISKVDPANIDCVKSNDTKDTP